MTPRLPALILAAALSWPAGATAQSPLSEAEFEAYVTGKTLFYAQHGMPYGVEEYLAGRRVRWSFLDGDCVEGRWYGDGPLICFAYDDRDRPQCWEFYLDANGLSARVSSDPEGEWLYEVEQSREPMQCLGPQIGV